MGRFGLKHIHVFRIYRIFCSETINPPLSNTCFNEELTNILLIKGIFDTHNLGDISVGRALDYLREVVG